MHLSSCITKGLIAGILAIPFSLFSSPIISIDSADYDAGTFYQDETKTVEHTFQIKNIGDSTLIINQVKASCGCTTVGHDSIIQPGKTGKLRQAINTQNMYTGAFRKYVTIFSNAKNTPETKVSLGGTLTAIISLSKPDLRLTTSDQKVWSDSFTLSTEKKDLTVSEVAFKQYNDASANAPAWQADLKIYPKYTFSKSDASSGKYTTYTMKIFFVSKDPEPKFGEFFIKTNHQKMPVIKVSGAIDGMN